MEMEDGEVVECIDDIVEILENPKQLKGRHDAQQAVNRLKQVKNINLSYVQLSFLS
jgi:hypothetical protein